VEVVTEKPKRTTAAKKPAAKKPVTKKPAKMTSTQAKIMIQAAKDESVAKLKDRVLHGAHLAVERLIVAIEKDEIPTRNLTTAAGVLIDKHVELNGPGSGGMAPVSADAASLMTAIAAIVAKVQTKPEVVHVEEASKE
jgi:ribonuclease HII